MINLVTACFDCNRGKSNNKLSNIPASLAENAAIISERENQIKQYRKLIKSVEKRKQSDINDIAEIFIKYFPEWSVTEKFRESSIRYFIDRIPMEKVKNAMFQACCRMSHDKDRALKYFCGTCWNIIRGTKYEH